MAWIYLGAAIAVEVTGTLALKASNGFNRLGYAAITVVAYALALALLGLALKHLSVGVAYAVWSALGTIGATVGGVWLFGERADWRLVTGVTLVIAGVVLVSFAGEGAR